MLPPRGGVAMIPRGWRVTWQARGDTPAGFLDFSQRARARGFYLIRKGSGFIVTIDPIP
jgi:hypothetical protein